MPCATEHEKLETTDQAAVEGGFRALRINFFFPLAGSLARLFCCLFGICSIPFLVFLYTFTLFLGNFTELGTY